MIKKIFMMSVLFASMQSSLFAQSAPYAGVSLGITTNTTQNVNSGSFRGAPLGGFIGFGGLISPLFYLAGELEGTAATATLKDNHSQNLRTTYAYMVSVLPGMMLSDYTKAYFRMGLGKQHFKSVSNMQSSVHYGLGLQTNLIQNIDIRGEYDYVAVHSFNGNKPRLDQASISILYKFE